MNNKWTVLLLVALAAAFALYFFTKERKFVWDEDTTFQHDDDEPFGCQLFDEMAEATLPNGYRLFDENLDSLLEKGKERCALLILCQESLPYFLLNELTDFAERGNKVLLVCDRQYTYDYDENDFDFSAYNSTYFSKNRLKEALLDRELLTKMWTMDGRHSDTLYVPPTLLCARIGGELPDGAAVTSARELWGGEGEYDEGDEVEEEAPAPSTNKTIIPLSFTVKKGKGKIYVVANTLLFTNYGVLDRQISRYLGYHLGMVADLPVVRVTNHSLKKATRDDDDEGYSGERSPLDHLLSYRPLRWAFYTLLFAAVLFMVFTARRRQRVMPIVERPANRNLEFVRLLGTIYYRRHDNHDLFMKKYTYFREELRRKQLIDLDNMQVEVNARTLAQLMGVEEKDLNDTLRLLKAVEASTGELGNEQLLDCVHRMNDILKHL